MRHFGINKIIEVCNEFGMNDSLAMSYYDMQDLHEWYAVMCSIPYCERMSFSERGKEIRRTIRVISMAISIKRDMLSGGHQAVRDVTARTFTPLLKSEIDDSWHEAKLMLKRDGWVTKEGKLCYGKHAPFLTTDEMKRDAGWQKHIKQRNEKWKKLHPLIKTEE